MSKNSCPPRPFVENDVRAWSDAECRQLLLEIEPLFLAPEGTPEADRADQLFDRIEAYEQSHFQITEWLEIRKRNDPILPKLT